MNHIWKTLPYQIMYAILYHGPLDIRIRLHIPPRKLGAAQKVIPSRSLSVHKLIEIDSATMAHRVFFALDNGRRMVLFVHDTYSCVNCFDRYGAFEYRRAVLENAGLRVDYYSNYRSQSMLPNLSFQTMLASHDFRQEEIDIIRLHV
jgi:hypothetical protein